MIVGLVTLQGVIGVLNGILVIVGSLAAERLDDNFWGHDFLTVAAGYICIYHFMGIFLGYNSILCSPFYQYACIHIYIYIYINDREMMNCRWSNFPV